MESSELDPSRPTNGSNRSQDRSTAERLATAGSQAAQSAKRQAESAFSDAKHTAAAAAGNTSAAIDSAAAALADSGQQNLSQLAQSMSQRLSEFAGYLEQRSVNELMSDAGNIAKRNPGLFIAGGVVLGIALSRFLKASSNGASSSGWSSSMSTRSEPARSRMDAATPATSVDDLTRRSDGYDSLA